MSVKIREDDFIRSVADALQHADGILVDFPADRRPIKSRRRDNEDQRLPPGALGRP